MTIIPVAPHALVTAGIAGLIGWRVYRRVRRTIGRQPVRPWALGCTVAFFVLAVLALAILNAGRLPLLEGLAGGGVVGVLLGLVGLRLTRFERSEAGFHYVPNTLLGIAVSLLFIGRLAYRLLSIYAASGSFDPTAMRTFGSSPLTLACFAIVAGYYVTFSIGVLRWYRAVPADAPADPAGSPVA
jgi:hypothetical protein